MKIFVNLLAYVFAQVLPPVPPPAINGGGITGISSGGTSIGENNGAATTVRTTTPSPVKLNWPGQSLTDPCGSLVEIDESLVNRTCTITYNFGAIIPDVFRVYVGGGAFIVPDTNGRRVLTGYDGISTESRVDVLIFWTMTEDGNRNLLNDTCGDAAFLDLECLSTIDGNAMQGVYFMETVNDYRMAKGSTYSFQIAGVTVGQTINIQLQDALGNPFECNNFRGHIGDVQLSIAPNCFQDFNGTINCPNGAISLDLSDGGFKPYTGGVVQFTCTQSLTQPADPDLWKSTISV